jgi:hypothetical protein
MFNTVASGVFKLNKMRDSYARLLQAARELNKADNPADLARLLEKSDQVVQNWKTRGVPPGELINIEEKIGALARWVATGRGAMTIKLATSTITADQQQILTVMEGVNPQAREALLQGISLLLKSHQSVVTDSARPQPDHGAKESRTSVKSGISRRRPHLGVPPETKRLTKKVNTKLKRDQNG